MSDGPILFGALVADTFALSSIPGGTTVSEVLKKVFKKRAERASEILIEELGNGTITLGEADTEEGVSILYRYLRAAQEGTARANLHILAMIIKGQAIRASLNAGEFNQFSGMLESLSYQELQVIGSLYKHWLTRDDSNGTRAHDAAQLSKAELIPNVLANENEWNARMTAILRTGLFSTQSAFGGLIYSPSILMDRLYELAPFDGADLD